jgi:hypothetical protein
MKFGGTCCFGLDGLVLLGIERDGKWFSKVRDIGQPIIRRGAVPGFAVKSHGKIGYVMLMFSTLHLPNLSRAGTRAERKNVTESLKPFMRRFLLQ